MLFDLFKLFGREFPTLHQYGIGYGDFPNVMQRSGVIKVLYEVVINHGAVSGVSSQPLRQKPAVVASALDVRTGRTVPALGDVDQRIDGGELSIGQFPDFLSHALLEGLIVLFQLPLHASQTEMSGESR